MPKYTHPHFGVACSSSLLLVSLCHILLSTCMYDGDTFSPRVRYRTDQSRVRANDQRGQRYNQRICYTFALDATGFTDTSKSTVLSQRDQQRRNWHPVGSPGWRKLSSLTKNALCEGRKLRALFTSSRKTAIENYHRTFFRLITLYDLRGASCCR